MKEVTRKEATRILNDIYNHYEVVGNKLSTTYRKIFKDERAGTWRLIGYAHNYNTPIYKN